MQCPFCNSEVEQARADMIAVIDGDCPSSCDDAVVVKIACGECGRPVFAKTIDQPYATWREWLAFVQVLQAALPSPAPSERTDKFCVDTVDGRVYLFSGGVRLTEIIASNEELTE